MPHIKNFLFIACVFIPLFAYPQTENPAHSTLHDQEIAAKDVLVEKAKAIKQNQEITAIDNSSSSAVSISSFSVNLREVFSASPIIYSLLLFMSIGALSIWLYSLATFSSKKAVTSGMISEIKQSLKQKNYAHAITLCSSKKNILSNLLRVGISSRNHGPQFMTEAMKAEGKRLTAGIWQKISLLNDIVLIAPMLGLLGTVIGMFYAFYDMNRSAESLSALFDGLGIAVGTTVAGLIVSILAMIFSTTLKYRLVKTLNHVENEAIHITHIILADKNEGENV
jgi:biopolymer transport protein ExbB